MTVTTVENLNATLNASSSNNPLADEDTLAVAVEEESEVNVGHHSAFVIVLPILWFLVYWTTCITFVIVSVRKKYVRHKIPIICTAGAKNETHTIFIIGNILSSCLLIATLWPWAYVVVVEDNSSSRHDDLNSTITTTTTALGGAISGTLAGLFFVGMAWYSVLDYKMRHDLLALLGGIATYIQGGFMIANAHHEESQQQQHNSSAAMDTAGFVWQARLVATNDDDEEEEGKGGRCDDNNNETNGEFLQNDAEDHNNDDKDLAVLSSSEIIIKPWDKYVIQGAALRFVAMMAYSGLNLTTIPDLLPQTFDGQ